MNTFITSSTSSIEKQIRGLPEESGIYTYGYDEFGQNLYRNQGQIQPFGYTGYQSDRIAGTYYAQAREYRAELGRFAAEDLIKKGLNWYIYCQNNALKYYDPLGLEKIVISGGVYSEDKRNNNTYYYEFVDASIAQINEWNKLNSEESIMWIIADNGWSELNKRELEKTAESLDVNIQFITDKDELFDYLNNKGGDANEREEDKITDISVFSHGLSANNGINEIKSESFAEDLNSNFYSCNLGTAGEDSFAQKWVDKFGGITTAFKGKTDYAKVPDNSWSVKIVRKLTQMLLGVSVYGGCPHFPIAGIDAEQLFFRCNDFQNSCID